MIRGEIRWNHVTFLRKISLGNLLESTRNWSKASQVPKSNLATSQDTTFLEIWDVVVSWSRQSEWKMRGFGWDGRWIWLVTVDGCWLSFWLEIACCRKKIWSCIFVFVRPIVRTMYVFLGERCHQRKDLCFRSLGFLWEGTSKKASSQSTNLSWWSDQPSLSAIWKHPMNLLPLYKKPRQPTPICICRWRIRSFPRDSLVTYIPADSFLPFIFGSSRAILNEKLPVFFAVITYPFVFPSFLGPGTKDHI